MIKLNMITWLSIGMLLVVNTSYSQVLVGITKDGLIFSENLYSEQKGKTKNANRVPLNSIVLGKYKKVKQRISPLLSSETDTIHCKVYVFGNKKLIVKYCGMALFDENRFLWGDHEDCISNNHDYDNRGNAVVYFVPLFSDDFKSLLYKDDNSPMFINRSAIVEVDLGTGKKYVIKDKCKNPTYSPDAKYILLQDLKKDSFYYVYDRALKKIIRTYRNLRRLYWIE